MKRVEKLRNEIIEKFNQKGEVEIYSPIVDYYTKGAHSVPWSWGEDYFIKILPNPGGNRILLHFGRRVWKRVGGTWKKYDSYYKIKNKEIKDRKELEFILNSSIFTEFVNSVNWD